MSAAASTKGSGRPRGGVKAPARGGGRALPGGAAGRDMGAGRARRVRPVFGHRSAIDPRGRLSVISEAWLTGRALAKPPHPAPHDQIVAAPSGRTDAIPTLYRRDTDAVLTGSGRAK